jgi:ABC-type nickel/cobalt efflux system permease component RcnA
MVAVARAHHGHEQGGGGRGNGPQGLLSVAVGLAPCTGAILVMLFALANGMLLVGLAMVAAIGAGMAVTMAAIGLAAIYARARMMARLSGDETRGRVWGAAFQLAGAFVITLLSTALLIDAL